MFYADFAYYFDCQFIFWLYDIILNYVPCKLGRNSLSKKQQLILFGVVGLNGLDLDDDCGIALSEGLAFGSDSTGYIT